jgi:hypothetical protein
VALEQDVDLLGVGQPREGVAAGEDEALGARAGRPLADHDAGAAADPAAVLLEGDLDGGGEDALEHLLAAPRRGRGRGAAGREPEQPGARDRAGEAPSRGTHHGAHPTAKAASRATGFRG